MKKVRGVGGTIKSNNTVPKLVNDSLYLETRSY